jgi:BlaI family transcriptional regulator, penicillinase repressor
MKENDLKPSEGEMEILQVLWQKQPASVREIHESLQSKKDVGYTTTLKQVQRMLDKGMLKRDDSDKIQTYTALLNEHETKARMVERLANTLFKGSAMDMVLHALGNTSTSSDELEKLKAWLTQKEKGGYHE